MLYSVQIWAEKDRLGDILSISGKGQSIGQNPQNFHLSKALLFSQSFLVNIISDTDEYSTCTQRFRANALRVQWQIAV